MSENKPKYNVGDQVQLISGGPSMTIQRYDQLHGGYRCQWFAGKKLDNGVFPEDSLVPYVPPKVDSEVKKK